MSNEPNDNQFSKPNFASDQWTRDYIAATANGPLKPGGKQKVEDQAIDPSSVPGVTLEIDTAQFNQALKEAGLFAEDGAEPGVLIDRTVFPHPVNVQSSLLGMEGASEELLQQVLTPDRPKSVSAREAGASYADTIHQISRVFSAIGEGYANRMAELNAGATPADGDDYTYAPTEFAGLVLTEQEQTNYGHFRVICEQALELFMVKNREYGNSIVRTGALGSIVAMTGDIAKLRTLVLHNLDSLDLVDLDNVRDKLRDVLVQAVIGIMMLNEENILGSE